MFKLVSSTHALDSISISEQFRRWPTSKDLPNHRLNCFRIWWTRILLMAPYCVWYLPQINIFYLLQARWITVCSNILRLYVQTAKPSQKLIKLVKYIVLVYCPILFDIKWKPEATNGKNEFSIFLALFTPKIRTFLIASYFALPRNTTHFYCVCWLNFGILSLL